MMVFKNQFRASRTTGFKRWGICNFFDACRDIPCAIFKMARRAGQKHDTQASRADSKNNTFLNNYQKVRRM
jgi:hypothetical protein